MKKVSLSILLLGLILISFGSANLGEVKQNDPIILECICDNCTYLNLTSVTYANNSAYALYGQYPMTNNGGIYNMTFYNTSNLGEHKFKCCGDSDGIYVCDDGDFLVTPSGSARINSGEGIALAICFIIILIVAVGFFVMGLHNKTLHFKVIFFCLASVMILILTLFSLVVLTQILGGYPAFIESFEVFWMIIKIMLTILTMALLFFVFYLIWKFWQVKRGFFD